MHQRVSHVDVAGSGSIVRVGVVRRGGGARCYGDHGQPVPLLCDLECPGGVKEDDAKNLVETTSSSKLASVPGRNRTVQSRRNQTRLDGLPLGHGERERSARRCKDKVPKGGVTLYSVPYSEHSSLTELRRCIALLRPKCILPTVGCRSVSEGRAVCERLRADGPDTAGLLELVRGPTVAESARQDAGVEASAGAGLPRLPE